MVTNDNFENINEDIDNELSKTDNKNINNLKKKKIIIVSIVLSIIFVVSLSLLLFFKLNGTNTEMKGSGTYDDPYIIKTGEHLKMISNDLDAYYELGNNIDLGGQIWTPIFDKENNKDFSGTFDGKGYKISNFVLEDDGEITLGLFSGIEKTGVVKNVIINPLVSSMVFESKHLSLGFLCGVNLGTIENVKIEGNVSIYFENKSSDEAFFVGCVAGVNQGTISLVKNHCDIGITGKNIILGGITAWNYSNGIIEVAQNIANINAIGTSNSDYPACAAGISGMNNGLVKFACNAGIIFAEYGGNIGGIVGSNSSTTGKIEYSYNQGNVGCSSSLPNKKSFVGGVAGRQMESASISKCYSSGVILALNAYSGGIVGISEQSSIINTYWLYNSSGSANNGEYEGRGYCKKCLSFSELHNSSTLAVMNEGLTSPAFEIHNQYGIIFKWQLD